MTPEHAAEQVAVLAELVDLVVVVRGGPFSTSAYRPDAHTRPGFNLDLCRRMRRRRRTGGGGPAGQRGRSGRPGRPRRGGGRPGGDDQGADRGAPVGARVRGGRARRARPCILCNQACRVRDNRNPIVSCVGEPRSGHETVEPTGGGVDDRRATC